MPRRLSAAAALAVAVAVALGLTAATASAAVFPVTTGADSGPGSLREAIQQANDTELGSDTEIGSDAAHVITFASAVRVELAEPLPSLYQRVNIDGHAGDGGRATVVGTEAGPILWLLGAGGHRIENLAFEVGDVGVQVASSNNLVVRNSFSGQGRAGIVVASAEIFRASFDGHEPDGNTLYENTMTAFSGIGIDLGDDGLTENDTAMDADTGPNGLQNHPVVTLGHAASGAVLVEGTLHSTPGMPFEIDVYASAACDATGAGPSERHLGYVKTATDAAGDAVWRFEAGATDVQAGEVIVAQATRIGDEESWAPLASSELSRCGAPLGAGADLAVEQALAPAEPIAGEDATLTLTARNLGPADASDVVVEATVDGTVATTPAPPCAFAAGRLTCPIGELAAGATRSVTATLRPTLATRFTVGSEVWGRVPDPVVANNATSATYEARPAPEPTPTPTPTPTPGALPAPEVGKSANVEPLRGRVRVKLAGSRRYVLLEEAAQIPVGSLLDTRKGRVGLTSAADHHGATQTGAFHAGVFKLLQDTGAQPVTEARLVGGGFARCRGQRRARRSLAGRGPAGRAPRAGVAARKGKKVRRLWGSGKGRFRTRGKGAAATVRGTRWLLEDRCKGTLTKVRSGEVEVLDFGRRRSFRVGKGAKHWALFRGSSRLTVRP
jgi:hypothetical protein